MIEMATYQQKDAYWSLKEKMDKEESQRENMTFYRRKFSYIYIVCEMQHFSLFTIFILIY